MLIDSYFKHVQLKNLQENDVGVSDIYISNINVACYSDEYVVTNFEGSVPYLTCLEVVKGKSTEFKGYLKYKLGNTKRSFTIKEGSGPISFVYEGKQFIIETKKSKTLSKILKYENNQLVELRQDVEKGGKDLKNNKDQLNTKIQKVEELQNCKDYSDIILSFLDTINPTVHSKFYYFVLSNISTLYIQVLTQYKNGKIIYYSLVFTTPCNMTQVFSNLKILPELVKTPYFPHSNFIVSKNWNIVYESEDYTFPFKYPVKFILKILRSILLEDQIVFYSKNDSVVEVMGILELIKPFKWPHILCLPITNEMKEILESPLPFIVSLTRKPVNSNLVVIDLDKIEIINENKQPIVLENIIEDKLNSLNKTNLLKLALNNYFLNIGEIVLEIRGNMIKQMGPSALKHIINIPEFVIDKPDKFYELFFRTRMFLMYLTDEKKSLSRYLVEIGDDKSVLLLPYVKLDESYEIKVLKIWILLYNGDMTEIIQYLKKRNFLDEIAIPLLKKLSFKKEYEKIWDIITSVREMTIPMYKAINIVSEMPSLTINNLENYNIYLIEACDCKALIINEEESDEKAVTFLNAEKNINKEQKKCVKNIDLINVEKNNKEGSINNEDESAEKNIQEGNVNTKNKQKRKFKINSLYPKIFTDHYSNKRNIPFNGNEINTIKNSKYKEIKKIIDQIDQNVFDTTIKTCSCVKRVSSILVTGPNYNFITFLLSPENINMILETMDLNNLIEESPQAFWSILTYFSYFNLPIANNVMLEPVDIEIEEEEYEMNFVDGMPNFYVL